MIRAEVPHVNISTDDKMSSATFGIIDYVVFGASLVISFAVGIYFAFRGSNNNEVTVDTNRNKMSDSMRHRAKTIGQNITRALTLNLKDFYLLLYPELCIL